MIIAFGRNTRNLFRVQKLGKLRSFASKRVYFFLKSFFFLTQEAQEAQETLDFS